jgi:hypothetical protein
MSGPQRRLHRPLLFTEADDLELRSIEGTWDGIRALDGCGDDVGGDRLMASPRGMHVDPTTVSVVQVVF